MVRTGDIADILNRDIPDAAGTLQEIADCTASGALFRWWRGMRPPNSDRLGCDFEAILFISIALVRFLSIPYRGMGESFFSLINFGARSGSYVCGFRPRRRWDAISMKPLCAGRG